MAVIVKNNKPIELLPQYTDRIGKNMDLLNIVEQVFSKKIFTPLLKSPVTIEVNKNVVDHAMLSDIIFRCISSNHILVNDEKILKEIFQKSMINFRNNTILNTDSIFVNQSATTAKLAEATPTVIYTPSTDIIPVSRRFLAGTATYDEMFATFAFYAQCRSLGVYFVNDTAFTNFKTWLKSEVATISQLLSQDVLNMFAEFDKLKLNGLTESLLLRQTFTDNLSPYSFPRVLNGLLMNYTKHIAQNECGYMPFSALEFISPTNMVFININAHAQAAAVDIAKEWSTIQKALAMKSMSMISNKQLTKLTAMQRIKSHLQKVSSRMKALQPSQTDIQRAGYIALRKTRPTVQTTVKLIKKVLDKMAFTNTSMNTFKSNKKSFAKPNRRDPDDFNKKGTVISTKFIPDIHVYLDTSGSISEDMYKDSIQCLITIAKKLNVNLYFNSFSHILSQTTCLHTKDKSTPEIYKTFQKIPKVSGGTNFEQIWHFINMSKKRTREFSLIITDFEYHAPNKQIKHPKNLYYTACGVVAWHDIIECAKTFAETARHIDPNISARFLL